MCDRVYEVVGRITRVKQEPDNDIYFVLQDREDSRAHIVTESGDPTFRGNAQSPFRAKLGNARRMLEDQQRQAGAREPRDLVGVTVRVTGVGFFDMTHP